MIYPRICRTCGQRTTVTAPVADYDQLPRTCPPPCGGPVEPDLADAPGIAFKGRGWTPKYHA